MASLKLTLRSFSGDVEDWDSFRFHLTALLHSHGVEDIVDKQIKGETPDPAPTDAQKKKLNQL